MHFTEGNRTTGLFHKIQLSKDKDGTAVIGFGNHHCGYDLYETEYRFIGDRRFWIKHVVRGPIKNYEISTDYTRIT